MSLLGYIYCTYFRYITFNGGGGGWGGLGTRLAYHHVTQQRSPFHEDQSVYSTGAGFHAHELCTYKRSLDYAHLFSQVIPSAVSPSVSLPEYGKDNEQYRDDDDRVEHYNRSHSPGWDLTLQLPRW